MGFLNKLKFWRRNLKFWSKKGLKVTPVGKELVVEQVDSEESKNEEPIRITLEATPVEEESVVEQVDSEESDNEGPIIITLKVTPVGKELVVEPVDSEESKNEEPIRITLEVTPVEEPEEEKMMEDSIVEPEEMNIFDEEPIKKAAITLEEEFNQLRTLVATQNVEIQKIHDEMHKLLNQIYKREHKPVCSTWKKLCLVVGGAVLGFAGVLLMHYLRIEVDLDVDVDFTIKYIG